MPSFATHFRLAWIIHEPYRRAYSAQRIGDVCPGKSAYVGRLRAFEPAIGLHLSAEKQGDCSASGLKVSDVILLSLGSGAKPAQRHDVQRDRQGYGYGWDEREREYEQRRGRRCDLNERE
jgi:hypothetical protein